MRCRLELPSLEREETEHPGSGGGKDGRQLLEGRSAVQGHREPHLVVYALPAVQRGSGSLERLEGVPAPELFGVDSVAAFDLAVLVGPTRLDVAVPDSPALDGEEERERKLLPVVGLHFANGKGEGLDHLAEELLADAHVQPPIETKDPEPRAVIDGGVLVGLPAVDLHDFDVDLDRLAGRRLLEQLELPPCPSPFGALGTR